MSLTSRGLVRKLRSAFFTAIVCLRWLHGPQTTAMTSALGKERLEDVMVSRWLAWNCWTFIEIFMSSWNRFYTQTLWNISSVAISIDVTNYVDCWTVPEEYSIVKVFVCVLLIYIISGEGTEKFWTIISDINATKCIISTTNPKKFSGEGAQSSPYSPGSTPPQPLGASTLRRWHALGEPSASL